jgi:D-lactate dehydrogenase
MRIAFFEVSKGDEGYLKNCLKEHECLFFEESLNASNAALADGCDAVSVFIYSQVTAEALGRMPSVKCIATRSTGFDHIDTEYCQQHAISVVNVPYYGENTVAEHTFALILSLSRNVHKSYARGLKGDYSIDGLKGFDLKDKTLGVIGTGHIGLHVIRIAKGFGMHVLAFDVKKDTFISEVLHFKYASLDEVLANADIVTVHVPYNEHTHHLIDRNHIRMMKKGALLINTARGGIVETEALEEALEEGFLSGAGLDVVEGENSIKEESQHVNTKKCCDQVEAGHVERNTPLLSRDNVVFTPHIGFYSEEAIKRIIDTTVANLIAFSSGKIENRVAERV